MASTEAATALWAPAGGEFGLRLTQFDARARVTGLLPDSVVTVSGGLAYNIVQGDPDSTTTGTRTNYGTNFRLEASVRIFPSTRLGLAFNRMNYRENLETYFSPQDYHAYDLWLEYEAEVLHKWYFRTRGTIGLVAYRRGAFSSRLECDVIYRFMSRLSASLSASACKSSRFLSRQGAFRDDQYRSAQFSAALDWTL
jgi:hypothetical protein